MIKSYYKKQTLQIKIISKKKFKINFLIGNSSFFFFFSFSFSTVHFSPPTSVLTTRIQGERKLISSSLLRIPTQNHIPRPTLLQIRITTAILLLMYSNFLMPSFSHTDYYQIDVISLYIKIQKLSNNFQQNNVYSNKFVLTCRSVVIKIWLRMCWLKN